MKNYRISMLLLLCGFISNSALAVKAIEIKPYEGLERYILTKQANFSEAINNFSPESTPYLHKVGEKDASLVLTNEEKGSPQYLPEYEYLLMDWSTELKKVVCATNIMFSSDSYKVVFSAVHEGGEKYSISSMLFKFNAKDLK